MKIKDVMTPECRTCDAEDPVQKAAQMMCEEDFGCVPVSKDDHLVGMITDRDIVTRGVAEGRDVARAKVSELMSGEVYYCYDDQDCDEVAENMAEMQVRRMPVVNREKRLVGMLSLGDLSTRGAERDAGEALTGISEQHRHPH